MKMSELGAGEKATVVKILTEGDMRRRFFDMGLVENTETECLFKAPSGDPKAFLIRGAVIAIRLKDCESILVCSPEVSE